MKSISVIREKSFYRAFFAIALVVAGQNLLSFSVNLVDNIMLGNFDQAALSGNALSDQVQFFMQQVIHAIAEGIVILGAQYWGQKRTQPILRVTAIALRVVLAFCAVMFLLSALFPHRVIGLMTGYETERYEGARLLRLVSFSFPFTGISAVLLSTLRSVETVWVGLIISCSTLVISVALNYTLIFGRFGFPAMGVLGAGIATIVTRVVELLIVLCYILFRDRKLKLKLRDLFAKIDPDLWKDYRKVTVPIICSGALWGAASIIQSSILGHLDPNVIAANSVAVTVFQLVSVLSYGSANAAGVLTGKTIGQGKLDRIRSGTQTMQLIFLAVGLLSGGMLLAASNVILAGFPKLTPEAKGYAKEFMTVLSITLIGTSYQMPCLTGIVRGGGDTGFVFRNDTIFVWGVVIPSALLSIYVFHAPPVITFLCLKSDQILKCFVAVFKVNAYNWIRKLTRPEVPEKTAPAAPSTD